MADYHSIDVNDGKGNTIPVTPFIPQSAIDTIQAEFFPKVDDTFVVTFPRSGTTWTEQILHLLMNDGEQGDKLITEAAPWLEVMPTRDGGMQAVLNALPEKRLFTCHLPFSFMPNFTNTHGRYIYVARNPKDVAVSYYHHDCSKGGYEGTWEEHFELFISGKVQFGSYFEHVLPWWKASQENNNILFVKYEDMKQDLRAILEQFASLLAITLSDELADKVIAGSQFKKMSTDPKTNFNWVPQKEGVPKHYRKGIIGDWRNQFSDEQSQRLDALIQEKFANSSLQFNFGDGVIFP